MKIRFIMIILICFFLVGCSKEVAKPNPPEGVDANNEKENIVSQEEQNKIIKDFYNILIDNKDEESTIEFVDENIEKLEVQNADEMVMELEDYLFRRSTDFNFIFQTLVKYEPYVSSEIKSYYQILKPESTNIYTDGESVFIGVDELLDRALVAEKHIKNYPTGQTRKRAMDFYEGYIFAAILGSGNQYIYASEGSSIIRDDILKIYNQYIKDNKDTYTSKILAQYVDELNKDNKDLNGDNVLHFYDNIIEIIQLNIK